jgi:hypothetical protein
MARGGLTTPSIHVPPSLGGVAPSSVVVVSPADVVSATPATISPVASKVPGASAPDLVILELPSLVAVPRVALVAGVIVLGGTSSVAAAVPLFPLPPSATGGSGQPKVALPLEVVESLVQPSLPIAAFAPSRDAPPVLLGEGRWDHPSSSLEASRENAEEWERIQSASS